MTDDDAMPRPDLDRLLHSARPHTDADDDWSDTPSARRILAGVHERTSAPARRRAAWPQLRRPALLGAGLIGLAATVTTLAVVTSPAPHRSTTATSPGGGGSQGLQAPGRSSGPRPAEMALASYDSCPSALDGLRANTAKNIGQLQYPIRQGYPAALSALGPGPAAADPYFQVSSGRMPGYSTTNTQEAAVGEPDTVETDGRRIVTVSDGVLRVVDVAARRVTGSLDLSQYAGAGSAQLLMSGDRVLVLLGGDTGLYSYGGPARYPMPTLRQGTATFLLVDLSGAPRVVSMLHPRGSYLDARLVAGQVRLVVQSTPMITPRGTAKATRAAVRAAPLSAWQPSYEVTVGGVSTTRRVPCGDLVHPARYTGTSLLTVYSFPLTGDLTDPAPLTLAADASTVYASTSSLYLSSTDGSFTRLHRFDITRPGRPAYLGSGRVDGWLKDAYSLSDYDGSLRVVTTDSRTQSTSVVVLDDDTLRETGRVDGLGTGEQVHGVRFLGPLAYVVTFRSVDPLHVIDLSDPARPRLTGELVVPGYSDYLHPIGTDRLLGVGQNVSERRVAGLQVSLFDVADPARMRRVADVVETDAPGEQALDPHAFLYWPATGTAVVPIQSWSGRSDGGALVVHVTPDSLTRQGVLRNPDQTPITRTLVADGRLWTLSEGGLAVSDLGTLHRDAWVAFA